MCTKVLTDSRLLSFLPRKATFSDVKTPTSKWVVGTHIICTTNRVLHQILDYQSVDVGLPFLGNRTEPILIHQPHSLTSLSFHLFRSSGENLSSNSFLLAFSTRAETEETESGNSCRFHVRALRSHRDTCYCLQAWTALEPSLGVYPSNACPYPSMDRTSFHACSCPNWLCCSFVHRCFRRASWCLRHHP